MSGPIDPVVVVQEGNPPTALGQAPGSGTAANDDDVRLRSLIRDVLSSELTAQLRTLFPGGSLPPSTFQNDQAILPSHVPTFDNEPLTGDAPILNAQPFSQPLIQPNGATADNSQPVLKTPLPFILSRNCTPIPGKLVMKIQALQFVDMRELLPDNIAMAERLASLPQSMQIARAQQTNFQGQREISSITSWVCAFTTYVAILSQTRPDLTISRLAYLRNIVREAYCLGGEGWRTYDYIFRNQAAADQSLDWSELVPSLSLAYLQPLGPAASKTPCCLCQEPDHQSSSCALALLAHPSQLWTPKKPTQLTPRLPSKLPDGSQLCVSWNQGYCVAPGPVCKYRHVCGSCGEDHPAKNCSQTPEGSIFKKPPKRPARAS